MRFRSDFWPTLYSKELLLRIRKFIKFRWGNYKPVSLIVLASFNSIGSISFLRLCPRSERIQSNTITSEIRDTKRAFDRNLKGQWLHFVHGNNVITYPAASVRFHREYVAQITYLSLIAMIYGTFKNLRDN